MSTAIEKLMFQVGMIDKASGPASKLTGTFDKLYNSARGGYEKIVMGGLGLAGVGYTLSRMLEPHKEMQRALGEVKSLGVADAALNQLERTALSTSMSYGQVATDIVRSAYDIQSAISGLSGFELSAFTQSASILAKGTKASTDEITNYFGTMYGIFQNTANDMGRARWVQQLTGQTAAAVQMYKTTGREMSMAFTNIGAEAQTAGVNLSEQMAILGTLQATMKGSEAGTKYRAFLAGVGKAQTELGLQFTDSQGRMLPMLKILESIRGKYGDIDTVAKSDMLMKAFGSKEAVSLVKLMMQNTGKLAGDIESLSKISGMDNAIAMAKDIADPYERLAAAGTAIKTALGSALAPTIDPLIDKLNAGGQAIYRWSNLFPNLTRLIGTAALTVLGLVAAISVFAVIGGVAKLVTAGWAAVVSIGTGVMWIFRTSILALNASMVLVRAAALAGSIMMGVWSASLKAGAASAWLFNAALWANPITWVVIGVAALVGALVVLVKHWDKVTSAWQSFRGMVENNGFLRFVFTPLLAVVDIVSFVIDHFRHIPKWWQSFKGWLSELSVFSPLAAAWRAFREMIQDNGFLRFVFAPVLAAVGVVSFAIDRFKHIPKWWQSFKGWLSELSVFSPLVDAWNAFRGMVQNNGFLRFIFTPLFGVADVIGFVVNQFKQIPRWWQSFKSWLSELSVFSPLSAALDFAQAALSSFDAIPAWMQRFKGWLTELSVFSPLTAAFDLTRFALSHFEKLPKWWRDFKNWLSELNPFELVGSSLDWLIDKINMLPGINIDASGNLLDSAEKQKAETRDSLPDLDRMTFAPSSDGGLAQQYFSNTSNTNQGIYIDRVEVKSQGPVDGFKLADELRLAGG